MILFLIYKKFPEWNLTILEIVYIFYNKISKSDTNAEFIYAGRDYEDAIPENYVLTSYSDYIERFDFGNLTSDDFSNNNYAVLKIRYDSCSEYDIKPVSYIVNGNNIDVSIEYKSRCGTCALEYLYYLIKIDKSIEEVNIDYEYIVVGGTKCSEAISYKPIIYLYPTIETEVTVKLGNVNYLTATYPKYNDGWDVIASPSGKLIDVNSNRELYSLYWEGNNHISKMTNEGFVIRGEDTITFLEEKLRVLGLSDREAEEFIIYWIDKLQNNKYNYIRFETEEEINNYMPLHINPIPDTIIRVQMDYMPLEEEIKVTEQELITPKREGFVVVEWGGSLIY